MNRTTIRGATLFAVFTCILQPAFGAESPKHLANIAYASIHGRQLALDLHLPAGVAHPPLVVYVHGGAWHAGSKSEYPEYLVSSGFAVASVEFRTSTEARFPASVQDIKAAIRFLRAKGKEYGYLTDRIAVAGSSSGGHLAALVGTTNGMKELEGTVGDRPGEKPALARLASPITHVGSGDPPALLLHGNQDRQMPVNQSLELDAAYRRAGLSVETMIVDGAGHGGK